LCLDPGHTGPPPQPHLDSDAALAAAAERAEAMVRAGITTARDLGGGRWVEVDLRDRVRTGELRGPRLVCAGQPLTSLEGHCHFWGGEIADEREALAHIDKQAARGVDWIKVMATGGVMTRNSKSSAVQFERALLTRIVELATERELPVAAHCHATEGIDHAAVSGVRTVEHCSFADTKGFGHAFDERIARELASRGTWVSPTVNAGWQRFIEKDGEPTRFFDDVRRYLSALREAQVPLIASTDAGIPNVAHHDLAAALGVFARYAEMTPVETLRSATSDSARALGLGVLIVRGDPTRDLASLADPIRVVARGRCVTE
jgi:imidazolonepropionase-like amidohydrolase